MASKQVVEIVFPAGRWVGGSGSKGRQVEKKVNGVMTPQFWPDDNPKIEYSYGVAIDKTPGRPWKEEDWGQKVLAVAQRDFPQGAWQNDDFSWKIADGDSTKLNKKQKRNCDNPNYAGKWVLWFTSLFPPHTVNKTGSAPIAPESIQPGMFVQMVGGVKGNDGESPGVYLNHVHVAMNNYGDPITFESDASEYGLGQGPDPVGSSSVPVGGITNAAAVVGSSLPAPPTPVTAAPPAPVPTVPHTAPLDVPPPAAPRYVLGAAAIEKGAKTVEEVLAWPGWSLEIALQHSYVIAA